MRASRHRVQVRLRSHALQLAASLLRIYLVALHAGWWAGGVVLLGAWVVWNLEAWSWIRNLELHLDGSHVVLRSMAYVCVLQNCVCQL